MLKAVVGSDIWAWKPRGTEWADYYDATNYSDDAFESKKQIVSQLIHRLSPKSIWDIGSSTGVFSRLGVDMPESFFISTDIDPGAVEINYLDCKKAHRDNVLPLILDLTNPSPAIGWDNKERQSFTQRVVHVDLVMALALIHHLAIFNNLPLDATLTHVSRLMASIG